MSTPTVLENKNSLLKALSDFQGLLRSVAFLADLRLVQPITGWHLTTTLPPPSVPRAGILAPLTGKAVSEFPSSCLLYAGWFLEAVLKTEQVLQTTIVPILGVVCQPIFTTS
jgi:hypothetical protein